MKATSVKYFVWGLCALCVLVSSVSASPVVIGHRGYSAIYPENTLPALEAAASSAWGCEIDIRNTIDGEYILMHDATVDRTTDGTGSVSQLTFSYIRSLDAGSWKSSSFAGTQVPTAVEAINTAMANDLKLCIEIKAGVASELVSLLSPYRDYIEVHSFNESLLQQMANLDVGNDFTYVLIGSGDLSTKIYNLQPCIDKVSWSYGGINSSIVDAAHSLNTPVYAWTVNSTSAAQNLADMGVDAILSDNPALIAATLNSGNEPQDPVVYPRRLKDGLLAHWAFDEGLTNPTTRTAVDSVNGNNATFTDNLSVPGAWQTGTAAKVGGAIELDGVDDTTNSIATPDLTSPVKGVTISTWVKLDKLPSELSTSYGSIYDSSADAYVLYLDKASGQLRMKVTASTKAYPSIPESMLDTSDWHHVVGVYDGGAGTAQIYLDGQLIDVATGTEGTPLFGTLGSQIPTIGSSVGSNYFDGKLDEMSIWSRPLGQAEISYLYNEGQGRAMPAENVHVGAPNPVVQYRFEMPGPLANSGTGGTAYDATYVDGANGSLTLEGNAKEGEYAARANNPDAPTNGDYLNTSYQLTDAGAIAFWCKPNSYYQYNTILDSSGNADDWEMWIYDTGIARFRIEGDSYVSAQLGDADEWYHIVVQWAKSDEGAVLSLFLNGELADFDTGTWIDPAENLYLFGGNTGNDFGNASLDDFRIYDSILTSDEIRAIYLQSEAPSVPEPSTTTLLLGTLLLAWFFRRRKS